MLHCLSSAIVEFSVRKYVDYTPNHLIDPRHSLFLPTFLISRDVLLSPETSNISGLI